MYVDKKSWHARVYRWWYIHKYGSHYAYSLGSTNLCPYMRAVMFWAPLRLLFWDWVPMFTIKDTQVPTNLVTIPIMYITVLKMIGYATYTGKSIMIIVGIAMISGGILVVMLAAFALWAQQYKLGRKLVDSFFSPLRECVGVVVKKSRISSFFELLHALLRSAHDGVCPSVDFVEE